MKSSTAAINVTKCSIKRYVCVYIYVTSLNLNMNVNKRDIYTIRKYEDILESKCNCPSVRIRKIF